jgi:pimeloyl-ACP methyl ester carboxylesterase
MPTIDIQSTVHTYDLTLATDSPTVLVFIHGWLLSHAYWQPLIDQLRSDFSCLSYDLRGFGSSQVSNGISPQEADYSPLAYAQDLLVLLDRLNISKAWLVGHSFGGEIALWTAVTQPERIVGITCLNFGGGIYLKEEFERFRKVGRQLVQMRPAWLCYLPGLDCFFARVSVAQPLPLHWGRQRLFDFVRADYAAAVGSLWGLTEEAEVHQVPQVVARLQQPIYFVAGLNDPIIEPKYVRHLASFHPLFEEGGANLIELAACGHLAMLERSEILAEKLREILKA